MLRPQACPDVTHRLAVFREMIIQTICTYNYIRKQHLYTPSSGDDVVRNF